MLSASLAKGSNFQTHFSHVFSPPSPRVGRRDCPPVDLEDLQQPCGRSPPAENIPFPKKPAHQMAKQDIAASKKVKKKGQKFTHTQIDRNNELWIVSRQNRLNSGRSSRTLSCSTNKLSSELRVCTWIVPQHSVKLNLQNAEVNRFCTPKHQPGKSLQIPEFHSPVLLCQSPTFLCAKINPLWLV